MKFERYSRLVIEEIVLLILMSALGAYIGIHANIDTSFKAPFYQSTDLLLIVFHAVLGLVLLAVAALLFMDLIQQDDEKVVAYSTIGFASMMIAYIAGLLFVLGGAVFVFSFMMSAGFIVSILSYIVLALRLKHMK